MPHPMEDLIDQVRNDKSNWRADLVERYAERQEAIAAEFEKAAKGIEAMITTDPFKGADEVIAQQRKIAADAAELAKGLRDGTKIIANEEHAEVWLRSQAAAG